MRSARSWRRCGDEQADILLPTDLVVASEFKEDADSRVVEAERHTGRLDGAGHRTSHHRRLPQGYRRGQDHILERSHGGVRVGAFRGRHARRRGGHSRVRGDNRGRWGRHHRRHREVWPGGRFHPYLDRRRSLHGTPGGERRCREWKYCRTRKLRGYDHEEAAHRRQLEDVQEQRGGHGAGPRARSPGHGS